MQVSIIVRSCGMDARIVIPKSSYTTIRRTVPGYVTSPLPQSRARLTPRRRIQINGSRVQKGHTRIMRDGNEIAFGSPMPQQNPLEDYRYIYRHLAPLELTGIHAHYDMAHELGKGSFATVMKAMARETGEWWAVKIIHGNKVRGGNNTNQNQNGGGNQYLQSFAREISILETLDHPNICRLRETFVPEDGSHDFCTFAMLSSARFVADGFQISYWNLSRVATYSTIYSKMMGCPNLCPSISPVRCARRLRYASCSVP